MTVTIAPTATQLQNVVKVFTKTNYDAIISDAAAYFQCEIEDVALLQIKNPANEVRVQIGVRGSQMIVKTYGVVKYKPCWIGHSGYIFTSGGDLVQPLPYAAPASNDAPPHVDAIMDVRFSTTDDATSSIPCNVFYHIVAMEYAHIFRTSRDHSLDEIKRRYDRMINSSIHFTGNPSRWHARKAAYEALIAMRNDPTFYSDDLVIHVGG